VKKSYIVAPFLVILLLLCGCAAKVTTTTATPTTNAPTTTAPSSTSTTAATISTASTVFTAQLSGAQVVPPVDTPAAGSVTFTVDPTGTRVHFVLKVSNITDAVAARLHEGQPGAKRSRRGHSVPWSGPKRHLHRGAGGRELQRFILGRIAHRQDDRRFHGPPSERPGLT